MGARPLAPVQYRGTLLIGVCSLVSYLPGNGGRRWCGKGGGERKEGYRGKGAVSQGFQQQGLSRGLKLNRLVSDTGNGSLGIASAAKTAHY